MNFPFTISQSSRQLSAAGYDSYNFEIQQQSDYEQKQHQIPQQQCCMFCKRVAIKPISLICNHNLCLECGNFIKEQEQDSGVQPKYRVSCPACQSNTVTYNVKNLLVQSINEKAGNEVPLKILSVQASPGSKKNLRKSSITQQQLNTNGSKSRDPSITQESCYNVKTAQDTNYIRHSYQNNKSMSSLEYQSQTQRVSSSLSKQNNQNQQTDKTLALSTSQSAIRNQSLGTPFSTNKNGNSAPLQNSPQNSNNFIYQSQNNNFSEPQFFTKERNNNILQRRNSSNMNNYVNCLNNMFSNSNNSLGKSMQNNYINESMRQIVPLQTWTSSKQIQKDLQNSQSGLKIDRQKQNIQQYSEQLKCHQHNDQYTLFCLSDKSLLCIECLYSQKTHKNHNIIPLKNASQVLKKENDDFKNQSELYLRKLVDSIQISKQNQITLDREYQKCNQKVNDIFDSMIATVNAKRDKLLEQLEQSYKIHLNGVQNQYCELESIKNILEEYRNFDEQIAENAYSEQYIFSAFKMIQQTLQLTNLDQMPIKVNFNIMQIENSHQQLFNKLIEKIVQLQSVKPEERLNQTRQSKVLEQNSQIASSYTSSIKQNINSNYSAYAPPTQSSNTKDTTPKKYHISNNNQKNNMHQSKNNSQPITNSANSSHNGTQRGSNNKQKGYTSSSYSEKVQKKLNTQASSKVSYKNIKRKLSTDFNTMNTNSSKENIHVYPQYYQQIKPEKYDNIKKRSNSIAEDNITNQQVRLTQDIQQSYDFNLDQQARQYLKQVKSDFENQGCGGSYNYGNAFLKEHFCQNNYQTIAKDTTVNTTNISLTRSPFKEYIIN
ncbi:hypothetical protein ABPG72_017330 [Tetrahymena utriculariae]